MRTGITEREVNAGTSVASFSGTMLDGWRDPRSDARIAVELWLAQEPVDSQFIERPRELRMVWNYLRRVGPLAVARKIRSRLAERRRNRKIIGLGVGRVVDAPPDGSLDRGQRVLFLATNHGSDWPRVVVDIRLVTTIDAESGSVASSIQLPLSLRALAGWSPFSGRPLDADDVQRELRTIAGRVPAPAARPQRVDEPVSRERMHRPSGSQGRSAVLFGLGNYAKTAILPHVRATLNLSAVHEIDPDQIASAAGLNVTLDTSPWPRDDERYDVWFIAGFHHMHAPLAVRALRDGAYAVIEKPLATTREQFVELRDAFGGTPDSRLFACFQKRHGRMAEWACTDLRVAAGAPIDMHTIVYEIPLPERHWYNWPSSGSRLISNGCHWLDFFMFMNAFSPVRESHVHRLRGSDLVAWARLENGAQLVMSLTDTGSERLGVRDVIDLRAGDVTVRMIDATYYEAENSTRVVRRRRVNPMDAYGRMYRAICRRIANGEPGDSLESLRSTALMLDLEEQLQGTHTTHGH